MTVPRRCHRCGGRLVVAPARGAESHQYSSVAQWQSIRLLTGGLLVRVQPEEPILSTTYKQHVGCRSRTVGDFVGSRSQKSPLQATPYGGLLKGSRLN